MQVLLQIRLNIFDGQYLLVHEGDLVILIGDSRGGRGQRRMGVSGLEATRRHRRFL